MLAFLSWGPMWGSPCRAPHTEVPTTHQLQPWCPSLLLCGGKHHYCSLTLDALLSRLAATYNSIAKGVLNRTA